MSAAIILKKCCCGIYSLTPCIEVGDDPDTGCGCEGEYPLVLTVEFSGITWRSGCDTCPLDTCGSIQWTSFPPASLPPVAIPLTNPPEDENDTTCSWNGYRDVDVLGWVQPCHDTTKDCSIACDNPQDCDRIYVRVNRIDDYVGMTAYLRDSDGFDFSHATFHVGHTTNSDCMATFTISDNGNRGPCEADRGEYNGNAAGFVWSRAGSGGTATIRPGDVYDLLEGGPSGGNIIYTHTNLSAYMNKAVKLADGLWYLVGNGAGHTSDGEVTVSAWKDDCTTL